MLSYDFHNGAAHNGSIRYGGHRGSLLRRGNTKANSARNVSCFFSRLNHRRHVISQLLTHSGNAHGRYAIQKAFGFVGNSLDTLVGGRCNHGNQAHIVFLAKRQQFLLFLIRHIGNNQRINADSLAIFQKPFRSVRKNRVDIRHERHRYLAGLADSPNHLENFIGRRSRRQGANIRFLNDRPFGDRIGKGNPQFNQIRSRCRHLQYKLFRHLQRRIACGNKRNKGFSLGKGLI